MGLEKVNENSKMKCYNGIESDLPMIETLCVNYILRNIREKPLMSNLLSNKLILRGMNPHKTFITKQV